MLDDLVGNLVDITLDLGIGELASDETLGGEECVLGVHDGLTLGSDTDQALAILGEGDNGRSGASTFNTSQRLTQVVAISRESRSKPGGTNLRRSR